MSWLKFPFKRKGLPSYFLSCKYRIRPNWAASWQNQQNGICAQRRLRSAWASAQTDQSSLSAWRDLGSLASHWAHSRRKTLIRLGGCLGWSESSLGAQVILLVLSRGGSIRECFSVLLNHPNKHWFFRSNPLACMAIDNVILTSWNYICYSACFWFCDGPGILISLSTTVWHDQYVNCLVKSRGDCPDFDQQLDRENQDKPRPWRLPKRWQSNPTIKQFIHIGGIHISTIMLTCRYRDSHMRGKSEWQALPTELLGLTMRMWNLSTKITGSLKKLGTDNCPTWISGAWPNFYERYVAGPEDRTRDFLNNSRTVHLTDLAGPCRDV